MRGHYNWKGLLLLMLALTFSLLPAYAQSGESTSQTQQAPPVTPGQTNPPSVPKGDQDASSDNEIKTPLPSPPELEVRAIGSSTPLPTYDTLLRWGPVYVREIELLQTYDQIKNVPESDTNTGIFDQGSFNSTILRAAIVYDRPIGQNRLTLQYSPRLTVVNGHVGGDFMNQTVEFNWIQQLSPRWTLGVSNSFGYFSVRSLYGDYFLDVNAVTGTNVPVSFLNGGGTWLNTTTSANFAYALSPTSSISVAPFFGYGRVTGQANGSTTSTTTTALYQYGSQFAWNKQLSPFRSIHATYYYRIVGDLGNGVPYQSGEIGISQQIGPSTVVGATVGVLSEGFLSGTQWNFSGSVQASKKWGPAVVSVGYYRGLPLFSELNSQGVAQTVQGTLRLNLSQRWYWNFQAGYQESMTPNIISVSGKYLSTEVGYNLTPQVSFMASYAHLIQTGDNQNLLVGTRNYVLGGIRWVARPAN